MQALPWVLACWEQRHTLRSTQVGVVAKNLPHAARHRRLSVVLLRRNSTCANAAPSSPCLQQELAPSLGGNVLDTPLSHAMVMAMHLLGLQAAHRKAHTGRFRA